MFERLWWVRRLQLAIAIAAVAFVLILGVLALRTALGKDPVLGAAGRGHAQPSETAASGGPEESDLASIVRPFVRGGSEALHLVQDGGESDSSGTSPQAQAPMITSQS